MTRLNRVWPALACFGLPAVLAACGATPGAPIREEGVALVTSEPEIVHAEGEITFPSLAEIAGQELDGELPAAHRVREGDSLYAIAYLYGVDYRQIAAANDLAPPYTIYVGQELSLAPVPLAEESAAVAIAAPATPGAGIQRGAIGEELAAAPASEAPQAGPASGNASATASPESWRWPLARRGKGDYLPDLNKRLDIEGEAGGSVIAVKGGEVVYARPFGDDAGVLLIIRHDDRFLSAYTQVGKALVAAGERVAAGQPIVELAAGGAEPPIVRFNLQRDGVFVDPTAMLP